MVVLEVRGRKSGRTFTLPVDPIEFEGRRYLVCARGNSNWVHNARLAGEIVLGRAMRRRRYAVRELPLGMRSPILKAYLDRFAGEVQRFFPVPKGSPVEAFNDLAPRYPVFELQPIDESAQCPWRTMQAKLLEGRHATAIDPSRSCNKGQLGFL